MSHFTVLVIGKDPEDQLAPYDENIEVEDYITGIVTDKEKQRFLDYYINGEKEFPSNIIFEEAYVLKGNDWNGNCWKKDDNGIWRIHSTYNPDSKWDWYQLGGRWTGYFKLKAGCSDGVVGNPGIMTNPAENGWADSALKGDIDFEFMRFKAAKQAGKRYDNFYAIVGDRAIPIWNDIKKKYSNKDIDLARKKYNENPVIVDLNISEEFGNYFFYNDIEEFIENRTTYIQKERNSAISTFAVVKDGKWYERGKMGWWGVVLEEKDRGDWNREFSQLLDSLSDDTLLSIFDCHI
jgi:hypothetical protein